MKSFWSALLACSLMASTSTPAAALEHDLQGWAGVVVQGPNPGSGLNLWLEMQTRASLEADALERVLVRPAVFWSHDSGWSLWAGYLWHPATARQPQHEHRSWQQAQHVLALGTSSLIHRLRFEQRFLDGVDDAQLRLRLMSRLVRPLDEARRWSAVASDEVFLNATSPTGALPAGLDQNRLFIGLQRRTSPAVAFEFGYLNVFLDRAVDRMSHVLLGLAWVNF